MQNDLFPGSEGANHVIGIQFIEGEWQYHCDLQHSAYCELPPHSPIKYLGNNRPFLKGMFNVIFFLQIMDESPQDKPSPWFQKILDLVENETAHNTPAVPENWKCQLGVRYADTFRPEERPWGANTYISISKYNKWELIKWNDFDCRYALWIPKSRINAIKNQKLYQ